MEQMPQNLNTWLDKHGFPEEAKGNLRTLQQIKKRVHTDMYMTEEEYDTLDLWIDKLKGEIK